MAISRAFAYNTGAAIAGLTQVGNLAISGTSFSGLTSSLSWYNGPDESLGYVIAYESPGNTVPNSATFGRVQFWRSSTQSDATFISLSGYISKRHGSPQNFTTGGSASSWLSSNGYWTNWAISYTAGLYKTTYSGYFTDNVSFFATATPQAFGTNPATSVQTTVISEAVSGDGDNFSCQWLGYFKPTTTQTYTFYTNSDDASYVWVGANAISGFTTANATVNNGGAHGPTETSGSIALTAGVYYPIRIQFGESGGGDVMTFNFSTSTITKTTNVTGLVFYNPITNNF
jgi:hypothetical protein